MSNWTQNREALKISIASVKLTNATAPWITILIEAYPPCGPIFTLAETYADSKLQHVEIAQAV